MTEIMDGQVSMFDQDIWSGKTSPEPSVPTKGKTLRQSSKKQAVSQSRKPPLFLYLKKGGLQQDASWENAGALLGEFSMHSFGEHPISLYHNGVGESHLSQILEDSPHPKYSLSAKACHGILNRASRRGKKLPEMLEKALVEQSLALSKSEEDAVEVVRCKDCRYCQTDVFGLWCFNDYEHDLQPDDFCSYGERKDNG